MSLEAMLAVQELTAPTSHASFRVLMAVASHANATGGNSWASIRTLAAEAQMDAKTVRQCLGKLQAEGLLVPAGQKRAGRGNVTVWALAFRVPSFEERKAKAGSAAPAAPEPVGQAPGNGGLTPPIPAAVAPEPEPPNGGLAPGNGGLTPPKPIEQNLKEGRKKGEAPPSAAPPAPPDPRGTRLPDEWQPDGAGRAYAAERGLDADEVAEDFTDHWHAKPGQAGRKLDWPATWRTWCRREVKWHKPRHSPASPQRRQATNGAVELLLRTQERIREQAGTAGTAGRSMTAREVEYALPW